MCDTLRVRWTIVPKLAPQPWIACRGCGEPKAFRCSGKVRLNANGRRLDGWLIYRCLDCDNTWNRPLFERRYVRDIDPLTLEALHANDPDWIRAEAFNLDALRRKSPHIDEFADVEVAKEVVDEPADWTKIEIRLIVSLPACTRLDRLLAAELAASRSRLRILSDQGMLRINSDRSDALRRRVKTGTVATLDLSTEANRHLLWRPRVTGIAW